MNEIERESILLNFAWKMIDGVVNWAVFVKNDRTEPTNPMFKNSQHSQLLLILFGDFLSEVRAFKGDPVPLGLKTPPPTAASRCRCRCSSPRHPSLRFSLHLRGEAVACQSPESRRRDSEHPAISDIAAAPEYRRDCHLAPSSTDEDWFKANKTTLQAFEVPCYHR